MKAYISTVLFIFSFTCLIGQQNVGVGVLAPAGKLHVKGSADATQLVIDAHSQQSNTNPLIRLRNSNGIDLMWIHSDTSINTFVGMNTGRDNISGRYNTFIGSDAGLSNTTGTSNTAIGFTALSSNLDGNQNCAFGNYSLSGNISGYQNIAIGYGSLGSNTIGNNNVVIGTGSLVAGKAGTGT